MSNPGKRRALRRLLRSFMDEPRLSWSLARKLPTTVRGFVYAQRWVCAASDSRDEPPAASNPLRSYFDAHEEGRGIWKWLHYFDIYHRHFSKFVGREVHVLEIGVYSGGSLEMWRDYFGSACHVYGVDIEDACKAYEDEYTKIFVGDQADREFWAKVREQAPAIDIVIDDGGHIFEQQVVTLEEMLPHIRPGGVYLCEDVHGVRDDFPTYVQGLIYKLNAFVRKSERGDGSHPAVAPTNFQSSVHSIHSYPFVTVIEKADGPVDEFIAPKHGSEWQPFL